MNRIQPGDRHCAAPTAHRGTGPLEMARKELRTLTDHDGSVIEHYETYAEDFYLQDHHDEHIHFGYWEAADPATAGECIDRSALPAALHRLIEIVVAPAKIQAHHFVVDAGCGVGGTARSLAREFGCTVLGLDCTPSQVALAKRKTGPVPADGEARIEFRVADVTRPWDVEAKSIDVVVNIENACYYQRRSAFLDQVATALRPGGRLAMLDWMRVDPMSATEYVTHINPICQHWALWSLESLESYSALLEQAGLVVDEAQDLANHVLPNAHMLSRQAEHYDRAGNAGYATWCRVLANAWLGGKFTLGRLLATKPDPCAAGPSLDKRRDHTSETPPGATNPAPSDNCRQTRTELGSSHATLPKLCWTLRREGRTIDESDPTDPDPANAMDTLENVHAVPGDSFVITSLEWSDPVPREQWTSLLTGTAQGTIAIALTTEHGSDVTTPERTIAWNEPLPAALHRFLEKGAGARCLELRSAKTETRLVRPGEPTLDAELYRGSSLVPPEPEHGEDRALTIATGIAMWMANNVDPDGRLPYLWNTSEERPDQSSDNAIRRFLGAIGLGRFAGLQSDETLADPYRRNLAHLLDSYLEPLGDGMAIIAERHSANLGASALAGLAILAGPQDSIDQQALSMLVRAVASMTHDRRGFRTHFYPADRDGQGWEFYSGEALLFLCEAARRRIPGAPPEAELFVAYRRCRDRWRERRHVAFISWHSQALTSLYRMAPARELADFIAEMNDWLIELQLPDATEPDRLGEFGDPLRPEHGTPHASSTGVYLEGLADARDIARALGDTKRVTRYERTISLAFRSLRQLQFRDWRCTWYLERPEAVLGALRSNVNDNRVRIDNCGHALAGLVKLLSPLTLPEPASRRVPGEPVAREE